MTSETGTPDNPHDDEKQASELKASDFFPPGVGWNQAATPEQIRERELAEIEAQRQQH